MSRADLSFDIVLHVSVFALIKDDTYRRAGEDFLGRSEFTCHLGTMMFSYIIEIHFILKSSIFIPQSS